MHGREGFLRGIGLDTASITLFLSIQVRLQNETLQILLNKVDITDTLPSVNDTNTNSSLVFLQRTSASSLLTTFRNGIAVTVSVSFGLLSFVATIPAELEGMAVGLLGNVNGDQSDDFTYPNGTVLSSDATNRMIHDFGQSCE